MKINLLLPNILINVFNNSLTVILPHHHTNLLQFQQILKSVTLIRNIELSEDDLNEIETCWSVFKCFNITILD